MNLYKYILLLIVSPHEGWKDINKYSIPNDVVMRSLFYPCLALLAVTQFIPYYIGYNGGELSAVIVAAMIDFVKYFIGFFAISCLLNGFFADMFKSRVQVNKLNNFIAFCLIILAVFNILRNLMPGFPFFDIFPLYIIYVVFRGLGYLTIPEIRAKGFIALASLLLLLIPSGIKFVLNLLIPNM